MKVLMPNHEDKNIVNKVIYEELCLGKIQPSARNYFKKGN